MILGATLLFLQAAVMAPPNLVIRQGQTVQVVPVVGTVAGPYVRADLLAAALGGTVSHAPNDHYRVDLGATRIEVTEGVPFLRADSVIVPLGLPPLRSGRTFLLPYQIVAAIIPRYATGFNYDLATRELMIFSSLARRGPDPVVERSAQSSIPVAAQPEAPRPRAPRTGQRRLVVIDAGHGGPDNGMSGPILGGPRIVEKHVTLAVSRLVAQELRDTGVDVLMTRTTDTLIALSDRGRIANRNKADIFVSIHVNATGGRGAAAARERGYETYFLAEAKSEDARRVEQMENEAVKFETGANAPKGDPLSFIINDMAQNEHLRESNDLAETIQQGFRSFHPGRDRGVQ
ncbi:MAG: N-acetylmuramoyl-L-alanine amidase, partial [Longispora sp.]|nr:N-acetylmuramoyl-L-alanine amidase [Longispora sp. (in: high G+C Gram-positive bacteria)]